MRIIFKKFRTRMIVGCILAVIALLAVSVVVFINQPSFGRTPRGERLERVMKSPNYRNGGYDTHYAEIGNRFPQYRPCNPRKRAIRQRVELNSPHAPIYGADSQRLKSEESPDRTSF